MDNNIKIDILPNHFKKLDGTFDKDEAIKFCGRIAGVCYNREGYYKLENEPIERTMRRVDLTLNNGHHSVYDHVLLNFNLQNVPKLLAMVINNEKQYTTSEKSARYTPVERKNSNIITEKEENLYNKWLKIFEVKIKDKYGYIYNDAKIHKLAQENARYLVTIFMPTQMIYTTSFRQINYIASWMEEYIKNANMNDYLEKYLSLSMAEFIDCLYSLNVLEEGLMKNEKHRTISLFGKDLNSKEDYFGDVYTTTYDTSWASLAQAHRHRSLDYQMEMNSNFNCFVPPIIEDDNSLVMEWLADMERVKNVHPQGELVTVNEKGSYDKFILKCKERLCSAAQLEIQQQTKETLMKYKNALENNNHPLASDIKKYSYGARCTFPDFECSQDCHFVEGKKLIRKI